MAARKSAPKQCRQRGVCPHWDTCIFKRDAKKCLQSDTTADEALPMAVD